MLNLLLCTVDKQPGTLNILECLVSRLASLAVNSAAEDKLGPERPLLGDVPLVLDALVDDGVVVLEVGTEALGLEGHPQGVLVHGRRVLGPGGEVVGVEGKLLLESVDGLGVFEE